MNLAIDDQQIRCAGCQGLFASNQIIQLQGKPYCAECKSEVVEDLKAGVDSSGIELASIGSRFAAMFIDGLVLIVPLIIIGFTLGTMTPEKADQMPSFGSQVAQQLLYGIIVLLYHGILLNTMKGRTIGKKAMKLRVVLPDGSEAAPGNYWKREAGRCVLAIIPFIALIDYVMAFNKNRKTLHDKMGGTIVVRRP